MIDKKINVVLFTSQIPLIKIKLYHLLLLFEFNIK